MLMSAVEGKPLPAMSGLTSPLPSLTAPLPAWSHSGDNHSSKRILRRDRLQSLPHSSAELVCWPPSAPKAGGMDGTKDQLETNGSVMVGVDPVQRVFQLERDLRFLREQHLLVLNSLHDEVEDLKSRNKMLQIQLVMGSDLVDKTDQLSLADTIKENERTSQASIDNKPIVVEKAEKSVMTDLKFETAEESDPGLNSKMQLENQELRTALHDARNRNMYLVSLIEQIKRHHSMESQGKRQKPLDQLHIQGRSSSVCEFPAVYAHKFEEYEDIIQQLRRDSVELQGELSRVKTTLREVLCSNKWTPEAYMIARSVLQEGVHGKEYYHRLPRLPIRPPHEPPRRSSLPAINQHSYNSIQAVRNQQSLPSVLQSIPRNSMSSGGRHEGRYNKASTSQKRQQRTHMS